MEGLENNYAFVDSQNLNLSILDQGWQLDFVRFRKYLAHRFWVKKAFLFIGYVSGNENLCRYLQEAGYVLVFKPTLVINGEKIKGNVDAELVLHTMIEYNNYDKAVVVTGDGDFHCLVEYLIEQEKLIRLVIPNRYELIASFYCHREGASRRPSRSLSKVVKLRDYYAPLGARNDRHK